MNNRFKSLILPLTLVAALATSTLSGHAQNVNVTTSLTSVMGSAGVFDYTLTLNNTGPEAIESFWLGWVLAVSISSVHLVPGTTSAGPVFWMAIPSNMAGLPAPPLPRAIQGRSHLTVPPLRHNSWLRPGRPGTPPPTVSTLPTGSFPFFFHHQIPKFLGSRSWCLSLPPGL